MATRRLTAGNIVAAIFDKDFGFCDADSSRQEDGEDIYTDRGDAAIEWQRLLREESRCLTVEKNASSVMLQTLKTSKRTQKLLQTHEHRILIMFLSCSSHNCYFRE